MSAEDYPTADAPMIDAAQSLATAIRGAAAVAELCKRVNTTPSRAVVVGIGDLPRDGRTFDIEELEEIGCRVLITPPESDWIATNESEDSAALTDESYAFQVSVRRQALPAEVNDLGESAMYLWFWSHCAALPEQARKGASSCLLLKRFDGMDSPAWIANASAAGQGMALEATYHVTIGDE